MDAALTMFLRNGYLGTSMDEIAALAGVSKQTVYKQFVDKDRLFNEVLVGTINQTHSGTLEETDDLERDLHAYARELITTVIRPEVIQLRRTVIAEADRFPEMARMWYEQGPERNITMLASRFQDLADKGVLDVKDAVLAGHHFNWLILAMPLNKLMFTGPESSFKKADLHRLADEGVRVFLAAYR